MLTIATTTQTPTGSFALTLLGTSSSVSHTLALTFEVIPPNSNFSISVSPKSQSISRSLGEEAVYSVHITALNGFIGTVNFTTTGEPTNVLGFFNNPNTLGETVTGSGEIDFLYDAPSSPLGTFTLTIIATSGPLQHTIQVTCTVTA